MRHVSCVSVLLLGALLTGCDQTAARRAGVHASVEVGIDAAGGIRLRNNFVRQGIRTLEQCSGPVVYWHTSAGGLEPAPRVVTLSSHDHRARFTIVANCHPSRVVVYRDGIQYRRVHHRRWQFDVPNDYDNASRRYTVEVACEGDNGPPPWTWDFWVESSPPRMRGAYP